MPLINDNGLESPHDALHFDFLFEYWALRKGDWKLIMNPVDVLPNGKQNKMKGPFLVNLREDPSETTNLAEKYPEKLEDIMKLRREYVESLK